MLDFDESHLLFKLVISKRLQRSMHPVKGCLFRNPSRIKTIQQSRRYGKCFNGSNRYLNSFQAASSTAMEPQQKFPRAATQQTQSQTITGKATDSGINSYEEQAQQLSISWPAQ
jgi:hypothetical protein